jgi:saccharopine dehydrogenase-like NADP-dependent oxidoreductase
MPDIKLIMGAMLFVAAITAAGLASNKVLDAYGIANVENLTDDQRKEKATRNQSEWDRLRNDE